MADFAAMSHEKRVLYLAGLEEDGKPRFPMLRKRCTGENHRKEHLRQYRCFRCDDRGWLPVLTPAALMEAADTMGSYEMRNDFISKHGRFGVRWIGRPIDWCKGVTPAEAVSLALCRAVEGEK